ncbi:MAG: hypothetical protein ABJG86_09855 [Nitratireductor sp.]|uniref:hypothetical protein n=1 Tax=Parvibaculum sp. TaxID=2024848 RepID=UPI003288479F
MLLSMRLSELSKSLPRDMADELALLARLANSLEQEVEVHRLRERHRVAGAAMEASATEAFAEMIIDPEAKVLRPDFGAVRDRTAGKNRDVEG